MPSEQVRLQKSLLQLFVVLLFALSVFQIGCNKKAYRRGADYGSLASVVRSEAMPCEAADKVDCFLDKSNKQGDPVAQRFAISFLEFDDVGEFWSIGDLRPSLPPLGGEKTTATSQLQGTLDLISEKKAQAKKENRKLLVLTFVHGWHNNASRREEIKKHNLASFERSLQFLGSRRDEDCKKDPILRSPCPLVVGVFMAWRGEPSVTWNILTYWPRRAAANRVGGASFTEAVLRLALATKGPPHPFDENDGCKDQIPGGLSPEETDETNSFIIVGHSFGARILEHAVAQPLLAYLIQRQAQFRECAKRWNNALNDEGVRIHASTQVTETDVQSPLDLVVLVNPANDAFDAKSVIEGFKREGFPGSSFRKPVILAIKSDGDWGTGDIMFLAQGLSEPALARHDYDHPKPSAKFPDACVLGQLGRNSQGYYYKRSAPDIPDMRSHIVQEYALTVPNPTISDCLSNDLLYPNDRFFWADKSESDVKQCYRIRTVQGILSADLDHTDKAAQQYYSCDPRTPIGKSVWPAGTAAKAWNNTPYYVMNVPKSLIRDHNDIFQLGLWNLIQTFNEESTGADRNPADIRQNKSTTIRMTAPLEDPTTAPSR